MSLMAVVQFLTEVINFSLLCGIKTMYLAAQSPIEWVPLALSELECPRCEADHSHSANVEKGGYTSTPPYVFVAWLHMEATFLSFYVRPLCRMICPSGQKLGWS
jgi:hypothetical protein